MLKKDFYPLSDWPTPAEYKALGVKDNLQRKDVKAVPTGEFREPKAGEWFLSGAIIEAYRHNGPATLSTKYHIAKLVLTVTTTTVKISEV